LKNTPSIEQAKFLIDQGSFKEAEFALESLWEKEQQLEVGLTLADLFEKRQNYPKALETLQLTLLEHPKSQYTLLQLIRFFDKQDKPKEVLDLLKVLYKQSPQDPAILCFLAKAHFEKNLIPQALFFLVNAVEYGDTSIETISLMVQCYIFQGQFIQAQEVFNILENQEPFHLTTLALGGNLAFHRGNFAKSAEFFELFLSLNPENPIILSSYSAALLELGKIPESIKLGLKAFEQLPKHPEIAFNTSLLLLLEKKWKMGWKLYEKRLEFWPGMPTLSKEIPLWKGENLSGLRLLVTHEQGFGNTLQFCRFLRFLQKLNPKEVVFLCQKPLTHFLSNNQHFLQCKVVHEEPALDNIDFQVSLMSLPSKIWELNAFKKPPYQHPYLQPSLKAIKGINFSNKCPKIGLLWSGRKDRGGKNSLPINLLLNKLEGLNIELFSLQKDLSASETAILSKLNIKNLSPYLTSFSESSWVLSHLDLMITADTACAHLAGAQGTKTWLALPAISDWRWDLSEQYSSWYSSVKLIRQQQRGNWSYVLEQISSGIKTTFNV
jgi:tetratricopeptide (TPR) repeat protein